MQTIQLTEANAKKMYSTASADIKLMLEDSFTKDFFYQKITDRVQGWNDIISISGRNKGEFLLRPDETDDELAYREAKLIAEVYREGVVLDAGNTNQYKYYPWHKIVKDPSKLSGFGLSCYVCGGWGSVSYVGVRLCFDTEIKAIDAGKKFISVYERLKIR